MTRVEVDTDGEIILRGITAWEPRLSQSGKTWILYSEPVRRWGLEYGGEPILGQLQLYVSAANCAQSDFPESIRFHLLQGKPSPSVAATLDDDRTLTLRGIYCGEPEPSSTRKSLNLFNVGLGSAGILCRLRSGTYVEIDGRVDLYLRRN